MDGVMVLVTVVAMALVAYLTFALLVPEKFS